MESLAEAFSRLRVRGASSSGRLLLFFSDFHRFVNPYAQCMGKMIGRLPSTSWKEDSLQNKHSI